MNSQQISEALMACFVKREDKPNHSLDERWLNFNFYKKLNPKEIDLLNDAINILVKDGLISVEDRNGQCFVLSQKGYEKIYPIDENKVIGKIKSLIMGWFEKQKSRPNHILPSNLFINLFKILNPREKEYIDRAINELIEIKYILFDKRMGNMDCMVLTETGYDTLYK